MDYKQKYNEALDEAKAIHKIIKKDLKPIIEQIFPELKESEEEKIRKELIQYLKDYPNLPNDQYSINDIFTWLEKQTELITIDKPKFNCNDIIVNEEGDLYKVINVYNVARNTYYLKKLIDSVISEININTVDAKFHLWTIADSKKDNMIMYPSTLNKGECIFVFKETDKNGVIKFNVQKRS